ncbi:MAG: response regulator [Nitrospiraceae bacterium]
MEYRPMCLQWLLRYGVAVLVVIAALGLRLLLNPILGGISVPFITFFFAVMVAAWYGGAGPGIFAALASTVVADHFFIAPVGSFSFNSANVVALSLFVIEAIGISILSEGLHRAREIAEAGKAKMEHLLNSISDAFMAVDADGKYTVANQRAAEILGTPRDKLRDRKLADVFLEGTGADLRAAIEEAMQHRRPGHVESFHEPSQRWFEHRMYPYGGGVSIFFSDMTNRKQVEQQLTQWNAELEQRVHERTETLIASQTRLRALASELSLAEQRERRRLATEIHDSLAQMLALAKIKLSQVRRQSRLSSGQERLAQESEEIVGEALAYTRTMIAELSPPVLYQFGLVMGIKWLAEQMLRHGLTVDVRAEPDIPPLAEERLIFTFQSVRELLLNIVKHAAVNQAVVKIAVSADRHLQVTVEDQGCGFDPATITGADRFGLYSLRERIEAMGGRVDVISARDQGTTATLTVPSGRTMTEALKSEAAGVRRSPGEMAQDDMARPVSRTTKALSILLVDDHALVRQGLESALKGYEDLRIVGEAANGREAVERARRLHPDIVLMDVNMPVMDGVEATRLIKQEFPETTVIGLSVNINRHIERAMRDAGAAAYLTKETAVEELHALLHNITHAIPR